MKTKGEKVIGTELMDCPICDKTHEVEIIERETWATIKGESVEYMEEFYRCSNCGDKSIFYEFENGKQLDENLLRARNAYNERRESE